MKTDCLVFCWFVTNIYCFCLQIMRYSYADFESIPATLFACLAVFFLLEVKPLKYIAHMLICSVSSLILV